VDLGSRSRLLASGISIAVAFGVSGCAGSSSPQPDAAIAEPTSPSTSQPLPEPPADTDGESAEAPLDIFEGGTHGLPTDPEAVVEVPTPLTTKGVQPTPTEASPAVTPVIADNLEAMLSEPISLLFSYDIGGQVLILVEPSQSGSILLAHLK